MNLKSDFPIFNAHPELTYLDSGATTHKPKIVIDEITNFLSNHYGTVHRGVYELSVTSTEMYNKSRKKIQEFINAPSEKNIIFTKGTTASINLAAFGYVKHIIEENDEILITEIEHHANFVPWQQIAKEKKAIVKYAPVNDNGELDIQAFKQLINKKTKFISVTHISNVLGTILPIKTILNLAKENNIPTLIDGAQAIAHESVNIEELEPDFYCFSGHKMYGPTGIGVCYASNRVLNEMKPISFGGDMIESVKKEGTTFTEAPLKFESGTPPIAEAIGLCKAIEYIESVGIDKLKQIDQSLTEKTINSFKKYPWIKLIGNAKERSSSISFEIDGIHPHDIGSILDSENIAIRVGHHCAQPTMERFNVPATARVSFGAYNNENDIEKLMAGIHKSKEIFG
ncbi:cysteine desulfurase CsdA [Candidatus Marinamargulisbacteria bacterium SCGC AG-343-K17]|nr:cysteine desulfurase CsdA [Candidatus Marinamargulisbacteria bacterium SCGC AG-343-K17]